MVAALFFHINPDQIDGGRSSVTIGAELSVSITGFWRSVKNPTAAGTRIIKIVRHKSAYPIAGDTVCGVVTPLFVTSIGVPLAIRNPQTQLKMLAHPHASAVITVITIARVLFCISFLLNY